MYWSELDTDTKARLIRDGLRMGMRRWEGVRDAYDAAEDRRLAAGRDGTDDGDVIIDDPMGQWAHPGKVTRIPSSRITMRGVPYPVAGVSDTGDTMLMEPGNDYVFDGSEVTEYPVFQYGGYVPTALDSMRLANAMANRPFSSDRPYDMNEYERVAKATATAKRIEAENKRIEAAKEAEFKARHGMGLSHVPMEQGLEDKSYLIAAPFLAAAAPVAGTARAAERGALNVLDVMARPFSSFAIANGAGGVGIGLQQTAPMWATASDEALTGLYTYLAARNMKKKAEEYGSVGNAIEAEPVEMALDATMMLPYAGAAMKGAKNVATNIENFRPYVPLNKNRYYRIVDKRAIDDYANTGTIRSAAAAIDAGVETGLGKNHTYNMFSKGRPWQGGLATRDKGKPFILRSKENTGPIVWEESIKDFRHKGHEGIFRPSYYGDLDASPTQFFEYYEPKKIGYMRKDFPKSNNPYSNFMGNGYPINRGDWVVGNFGVEGKNFGSYIGSGEEQSVFNNTSNPNEVLKVGEFYRKDLPLLKNYVSNYVKKRNSIPMQEPITFVGIVDNKGYPFPVFSQNKLQPLEKMSSTEFNRIYLPQLQKRVVTLWIYRRWYKY